MVNLGDEVKDTVSGFKGIVIGKTEFLNGCSRVGIQPKVGKDGKLPENHWFDEPQIEVIKAKSVKCGPRMTGGPMISIPTRNIPG
jgi:hypothetical protein